MREKEGFVRRVGRVMSEGGSGVMYKAQQLLAACLKHNNA
jgi:hypothetical protein